MVPSGRTPSLYADELCYCSMRRMLGLHPSNVDMRVDSCAAVSVVAVPYTSAF